MARQGARFGVLLIVALLATAYGFRDALHDLWFAWQTDEYSHGIIVPLIACLLAWHQLAARRPEIAPSYAGIALYLGSLSLWMLAQFAAFVTLAEYGIILALTGLLWAFAGASLIRVIAPSLFYLCFAVPLPHLTYANLSQELQLLSSSGGVGILDFFLIPVFQEGNVIDLGGYKLQVVDACSGLRYLFPLMSFGYLIAYLLDDKLWKRMLLFFSTIPLTVGFNMFRIAVIGITVDHWGIAMAEGLVHALEGWIVFLICVALLLAEAKLLQATGTRGMRGMFRWHYLGFAHGPLITGAWRVGAPSVAVCLLALTATFISTTGRLREQQEIIPTHTPLALFPVTLGAWHGRSQNLEPEILHGLQLSDYWLADYRRKASEAPVNFYISYYASQHVGTEVHSPSNCIPGGGWQIVDKSIKTVEPVAGVSLAVTRLVIRRAEASQLVYYWFDERGRNITETSLAKWYLLRDALLLHRTDGALIRLVTPIDRLESEAQAEGRITDFLHYTYPQILSFLPGAQSTGPMVSPRDEGVALPSTLR